MTSHMHGRVLANSCAYFETGKEKKNAYKRLEQTNLHAQLHLQTKLCSKLNFSTMGQRKLESQAQLQDDSYNPRDIEGLHWISSLIIIKIKRA